MRIGELASQVGLRTSALRYYESLGILGPVRRVSGRRDYGPDALNTLRLLLAAQRAGFTLAEARSLLGFLADRQRSPERWRDMARGKLEQLDASIERLQAARLTLADALGCTCAGEADACRLVTRDTARRSGRLGLPKGSFKRPARPS
jgi:MerR family redox-sensitive transcriptional activator SoxR